MRALKFAIAVFIVPSILVLAMAESRYARHAFGQTAVPGPATPVPLTPPPAPGQPQSLSTIGAIPQLLPAPGTTNIVTPIAAATPRVFRCTCWGPGFPVAWTGQVTGTSYTLADQAASGQCSARRTNTDTASPLIGQNLAANGFGPSQVSPLGRMYSPPPGQVGAIANQLPNQPLSQLKAAKVATECRTCACN